MLFSSITFLYYFLPCVLFLYFLVPNTWKNNILLAASLLFYAWGEPYYVIFMMCSILLGYGTGLAIEKTSGTTKAKVMLGVVVGLHVIVLFYFKFSDSLPIGISFYTFQVISYMIDVYRGDVKAQKNCRDFAMYVSMFPQLIAGPIVRYVDIERNLKVREHGISGVAYGIRRFVLGLAKKVLLANTLGELCEIFAESGEKSVLFYWMYAVAFTLHVYFDFSGYSDMAIGLGKIFGFHFMENFNYPYISKSVTEFWRRWHISLGTWFRDYVYIPLGGNRVSRIRHFFNILIVWGLTGIWHGGAWTFLVWGLYFAALLMIEKSFLLKFLKKHSILAHLYTTVAVIAGFVFFDAANMGAAITSLKAMFGMSGLPLVSQEALYYLRSYAVLFGVGIFGATPGAKKWMEKVPVAKYLEPVVLIGLLVAATAFLADGSFNPFLYFRF